MPTTISNTLTVRVKTRRGPATFNWTAKVCQSCDKDDGIVRVRTAGGFRYRTAAGKPVRDAATLRRIQALAIPPAWEGVWVCPSAGGHIQATGRDARGRKQYRYHPAFRFSREGEKFGRLHAFGMVLPRVRRRVAADLARPGLPREKVLAAVVRLLDQTALRVGNAEYVRANKSFGLSTLLDRHATVTGGRLHIRFRGKSGLWHERTVTDATLARAVRNCRDLPGQELFQYRTTGGRVRPIRSTDVNDYIREISGGPFTAKDFRTWAGTVSAVRRLAGLPAPATKAAAEKAIVGVIREVAADLGNTPAVCRRSYVHPKALADFSAGKLRPARRTNGRSEVECAVLRMLRP